MKFRYLIPLVVVGLSLTVPVSVMGQQRVDLSTLVVRGDQYLVPGSLNPYTGPFVRYFSQEENFPTRVREWGEMRDGYLHGPYESYTGYLFQLESPLDEKGSYSNGERCGEWTDGGGRGTVTYDPCPNG